MTADHDSPRTHRGLIYYSVHQLLAVTTPIVAAALADDHHVVVLSRRWDATALRDALPATDSARGTVEYRPIHPLPHEASSAWREQVDALTHPDRPTLVISQFVPSPRRAVGLGPWHHTVASPGALTLVCLCALDADDTVRGGFHRTHPHLLNAPDSTPVGLLGGAGRPRAPAPRATPRPDRTTRDAPTVQASFTTVGDLAAIRAHVDRAATIAGLDDAGRARAVLAVHEAAVLACTLVLDASRSPEQIAPCRLRGYATDHRLVSEIELPRSITFPIGQQDRDPLVDARRFSREVSWLGSLRTRQIRLVARG